MAFSFPRMLELQVKAETQNLNPRECAELWCMEEDWHNDAIDPKECPSKLV